MQSLPEWPLNGQSLNGQSLNGPDVTAELELQRERLEAELADAKARAAAARHRTSEREVQVQAALRDELDASKKYISEMERQHNLAVEGIRVAGQQGVARIMAAHQRAVPVKNAE